jgi:hypothetical protein
MTAVSQAPIELMDTLPEERSSDLEWECILNDARCRLKLDAFIEEALREGPAELLNPSRL